MLIFEKTFIHLKIKPYPLILVLLFISLMACNSNKKKNESSETTKEITESKTDTLTKHLKPFIPELPTIGLLLYNGVLQSEVVATSDILANQRKTANSYLMSLQLSKLKTLLQLKKVCTLFQIIRLKNVQN